MGVQNHVAGVIPDGGVGVRVGVIKELEGSKFGGFGWLGLGGGEGSQCD